MMVAILPDAKIARAADRVRYASFWEQERKELEQLIRDLDSVSYAGKESFATLRTMQEFAHNVADMLAYLNDRLMPRDLANMECDGFAEILTLIGKSKL